MAKKTDGTPTQTPAPAPTPAGETTVGTAAAPPAPPAPATPPPAPAGNGASKAAEPVAARPALATGPKSLAHAKLAVMKLVQYIQKKQPGKGGSKGLNYSFASEEDIVDALHDACLEAGLVICPAKVEVVYQGTFTTKSGTTMNHVMLLSTYRLTHADSGESEDGQVIGEAMDTGDKCCNKAMTAAYKYFFRQAFLIPTGDDPDREPSAPMERDTRAANAGKQTATGTVRQGSERQQQTQRQPAQPAKPAQSTAETFKRCHDALLTAPNVPTLERYRTIFRDGTRGFSEAQVNELEGVFQRCVADLTTGSADDADGDDQPPDDEG